jgi:hypothetical protein
LPAEVDLASEPVTPQELDPHLVYRIAGDQLECALWTLTTGPKALAMFQTGDAAATYLVTAGLSAEWRVYRPGKDDLLTILKQCHDGGVTIAALDPDGTTAKRLFDLHQVLHVTGKLD